MHYYTQTIPLNCLLLDLKNARHGTLSDQNAVLQWMSSQTKVEALARSIAEYGFIPGELPMVTPSEDDEQLYVVLEGNRRTAVLKILQDPDKCPVEGARKKFRRLRQESRAALPSELECVVVPNLASVAHWLELRHLGEQEGAGAIPWGAKENEYFARRIGQRGPNDVSFRLLEYSVDNGLITRGEFDKVPLTNVTRLINTPEVRRELGFDVRKGEFVRVASEEYFHRALAGMLRALLLKKWTVSALKDRDQRLSFIGQIKQEQAWGSADDPKEIPLPAHDQAVAAQPDAPAGSEGQPRTGGDPAELKEAPTEDKTKRTSRNPLLRKAAIPSGTNMKIQNPKVRLMFGELKTLPVDDFTIAASVLTRVLIEACVDLYMEKHKLGDRNVKLHKKVTKVREHLIAMHSTDDRVNADLKGLEVFAGDHSNIGSANTFNAVVHNPKFWITAQELKVTWDRLAPCLTWFEGHV